MHRCWQVTEPHREENLDILDPLQVPRGRRSTKVSISAFVYVLLRYRKHFKGNKQDQIQKPATNRPSKSKHGWQEETTISVGDLHAWRTPGCVCGAPWVCVWRPRCDQSDTEQLASWTPLREPVMLFVNEMDALKNERQLAKSCRGEEHSARPLMKVL